MEDSEGDEASDHVRVGVTSALPEKEDKMDGVSVAKADGEMTDAVCVGVAPALGETMEESENVGDCNGEAEFDVDMDIFDDADGEPEIDGESDALIERVTLPVTVVGGVLVLTFVADAMVVIEPTMLAVSLVEGVMVVVCETDSELETDEETLGDADGEALELTEKVSIGERDPVGVEDGDKDAVLVLCVETVGVVDLVG